MTKKEIIDEFINAEGTHTFSASYENRKKEILDNSFSKRRHININKPCATMLKMASIILAFSIVTSGAVYAFTGKTINEYLRSRGLKEVANTEDIIGTENITADNSNILSIDEVYTDGWKIYFEATVPEDAPFEIQNNGDHAYVNGRDCLFESFEKNVDTNQYFGSIDLYFSSDNGIPKRELITASKLNITLTLLPEGQDKFIDYTFTANIGDALAKTKAIPDQSFAVSDNLTITVCESYIAPTGVMLNLRCDANNDKGKDEFSLYSTVNYYIEDSFGERKCLGYDPYILRSAITADDYATLLLDIFNEESDYIKLIPYYEAEDSDGKIIEGTMEVYEDKALVIKLK